MSTAATAEEDSRSIDVSERIDDVEITNPSDSGQGRITFFLADERVVSVPLSWSWRLQEASPEERQNFRISPSRRTVHWPDVDEDLSARGALRGTPAPRPNTSPPPDEPPTDWTPGRVKSIRRQLDLTQAEFADRLGVRQATISDWETGKQTPSKMARRLLDRIAGAANETSTEA